MEKKDSKENNAVGGLSRFVSSRQQYFDLPKYRDKFDWEVFEGAVILGVNYINRFNSEAIISSRISA
jgi:hypothetical protein